jgi:FG-GAP-like repeat/IPT/TIG domain
MRKRFRYLLIISLLSIGSLNAQAPVIQKFEPLASFPKSRIVISGSGFSSTPSQLQVWFGSVKGNILASSDFSIEVEVPAQSQLDNIRVVNLSSRLSAESNSKFMPVYSGEGFEPSKLAAPLSIPSTLAIFDVISTDIDGDNKPDLIGSRNETTATSMALMMNQSTVGNVNFSNTVIPSLNLNAPTQYLVSEDLNADGLPDLVASRTGTTANTVFLLRNTSTLGNPSFVAQPVLVMDIAHFAQHVEIEDLNGDGKPEIIVANSNSNELYIFKNESTGAPCL